MQRLALGTACSRLPALPLSRVIREVEKGRAAVSSAFRKSMVFQKSWRIHQARLSGQLDSYLEDKRLHIAAPEPEKTAGRSVAQLEVATTYFKKKMTTGPRQESIFVREADFAGVTEYRRVPAQVDFTDVGKVSASAREPAGTSGNVQRIGENGE
jgi:hypothetical protein